MCGESELKATAATDTKCHTNVAHLEAENICRVNGARLCTATELFEGATMGTGCNMDVRWVWSSTKCPDGGSTAVVPFTKKTRCMISIYKLDGTISEPVSVRCCSDNVVQHTVECGSQQQLEENRHVTKKEHATAVQKLAALKAHDQAIREAIPVVNSYKCSTLENIDFSSPAGDLVRGNKRAYAARHVAQCIVFCEQDVRCTHVAFVPSIRQCFLKSAKMAPVTQNVFPGVTSAFDCTFPTPQPVQPMPRSALETTWKQSRPMPVALGEVAAGLAGRLIVVIGQGSTGTFVYDTDLGRWEDVDPIYHDLEPRAERLFPTSHEATAVFDLGGDAGEEVFFFGGFEPLASCAAHDCIGQLQIYSPLANRWRYGNQMPFKSSGSINVAKINDAAYVCGGLYLLDGIKNPANCARYDPEANTYTAVAPMLHGVDHAAAGTDGERMFVFGGRDSGVNQGGKGLDLLQIYTPSLDTWQLGPKLALARGGMAASVFAHGKLWIFGGETDQYSREIGALEAGVFPHTHAYDPVLGRWEQGTDMLIPRHGFYPVYDQTSSTVYVIGGGGAVGNSRSATVSAMYLAEPTRNQFTRYTGCCRTTANGPGTFIETTEASLSLCKARCLSDSKCVAVEYTDSRCEIHHDNIAMVSGKTTCQCLTRGTTLDGKPLLAGARHEGHQLSKEGATSDGAAGPNFVSSAAGIALTLAGLLAALVGGAVLFATGRTLSGFNNCAHIADDSLGHVLATPSYFTGSLPACATHERELTAAATRRIAFV